MSNPKQRKFKSQPYFLTDLLLELSNSSLELSDSKYQGVSNHIGIDLGHKRRRNLNVTLKCFLPQFLPQLVLFLVAIHVRQEMSVHIRVFAEPVKKTPFR